MWARGGRATWRTASDGANCGLGQVTGARWLAACSATRMRTHSLRVQPSRPAGPRLDALQLHVHRPAATTATNAGKQMGPAAHGALGARWLAACSATRMRTHSLRVQPSRPAGPGLTRFSFTYTDLQQQQATRYYYSTM
ncbi:unnamed protein product [Urochloa humidicola]